MIKYQLKKYTWLCPSCGIPHELVVAIPEGDGDPCKWIRSTGLKWPCEMVIGSKNIPHCECAFCHTEFEHNDIKEIAKVTDGIPFNKGAGGEKPNGKPNG